MKGCGDSVYSRDGGAPECGKECLCSSCAEKLEAELVAAKEYSQICLFEMSRKLDWIMQLRTERDLLRAALDAIRKTVDEACGSEPGPTSRTIYSIIDALGIKP